MIDLQDNLKTGQTSNRAKSAKTTRSQCMTDKKIDPHYFSRKRILSFGGGVDSSAILLIHLYHENLMIDHVVFSDTGAESAETYANVRRFQQLCEDHDLPFSIVSKEDETITQWVTRLGIVPLMIGGSHVCSKKFKGDVIAKWAKKTYPDQEITYLIGIEPDEGHRPARFTKPKSDTAEYEYPLVDLDETRESCIELLKSHGFNVPKSSCVFCPFLSEGESRDARKDPQKWDLIKLVEERFQEESPRKHQAWIDAGKPLNKGGKCFKGHWRKDSWAEGARLFVRKVDGKILSVDEWEKKIDSESAPQRPSLGQLLEGQYQ